MTVSFQAFRDLLDLFVRGDRSVHEFGAAYAQLWRHERDRAWAIFQRESPNPGQLSRQEFNQITQRLVARGELLPHDVQLVLDRIFTDLDVLGQPKGITEDALRAECEESLRRLDALVR